MMKNTFISLQKLFSFSRYLCFCLTFCIKTASVKRSGNFKFYDVTAWLTNNCNTLIAQYVEKKGNQTMKFSQLIECNMRNIVVKNYTQNVVEKLAPGPFLKN